MISKTEAKRRSTIIKTLAHPVRIMAVEFLTEGEKTFAEIFALFDIDKSTVSKHLNVLRKNGIISFKKMGRDTIYKLETPCISDFFNCVCIVGDETKKDKE